MQSWEATLLHHASRRLRMCDNAAMAAAMAAALLSYQSGGSKLAIMELITCSNADVHC